MYIRTILFVLLILCTSTLLIPNISRAGTTGVINQSDFGANRLVVFWDTRNRDTLFQIANLSSSNVNIHVQVWDVASQFTECEECDFDDILTPKDTHQYDIENIVANTGEERCTAIGSNTYGFAVVSIVSGDPNSLVGVFRIRHESGYEYRANAVAPDDSNANLSDINVLNFSKANGHNLADLVGITFLSIDNEDVYASPGVSSTFGGILDEILIWDDVEDDTSCSPTTFACAIGFLDKGIDNALPNSLGQQNRLCADNVLDSHNSGWLELPFNNFTCTDQVVGDDNNICQFTPYFVGFIGLNNGDGTGSMDSWWSVGGNQ